MSGRTASGRVEVQERLLAHGIRLSDSSGRGSVDDLPAWRLTGMSEGEAAEWWGLGTFSVEEGERWWRAGYSPLQAEYVDVLARYVPLRERSDAAPAAPAEWRASGLPPHVVCLVLAAGVTTVDEARRQHAQARANPEHYQRLTARARARDLDPWRLSIRRRPVSRAQTTGRRIGAVLWQVTRVRGPVAFWRARQARSSPSRTSAARSGDQAPSRRPGNDSGRTERPRGPVALHRQQL